MGKKISIRDVTYNMTTAVMHAVRHARKLLRANPKSSHHKEK